MADPRGFLTTDRQFLGGGLVVYSRWPIMEEESHPWDSVSQVHFPDTRL